MVSKAGLPPYWEKYLLTALRKDNPAYLQMARTRPHLIELYPRIGKGDLVPPMHKNFFWQDEKAYYVPRHFEMEEETCEDRRVRVSAEYPDVMAGVELRPIQAECLDEWKKARVTNGLFILPTGAGKTVLGLEIARLLKQKTLILVDRLESGMDEWVKDHKMWFGSEPGIIQGKHLKYDTPITIAMFQTLWKKPDLLKSLWNTFGCVIVDEAQVVPADTFVRVLNTFAARYRYGVTATPERTDGLQDVMSYSIGEKIFERQTSDEVLPVGVKIIRTGILVPDEYEDAKGRKKKHQTNYVENKMIGMDGRNELLVRKVIENGFDKWNLCGTLRIWHAKKIANMLADQVGVENVGVLVKSIKNQQRGYPDVHLDDGIVWKPREVKALAREGRLRYVVGVYQYMYRGLDVPVFNAAHMLLPLGNPLWLKQFCGRTRREYEGQDKAFLYDYVDANGMPQRRFDRRKTEYRKWERETRAEKQKELF